MTGITPTVLSAGSLDGTKVVDGTGEALGKIEELMIDLDQGRIRYAVLSFGGFLGVGDKLFAVPWDSLTVDTHDKKVVLDATKETLEKAPGFDKDDWPDFADARFGHSVYGHYGRKPYWR